MPTMEPLTLSVGGRRNIPDVPSPRAPIADGFGALGQGVQALAHGAGSLAQSMRLDDEADRHAEEIRARREADKAYADYAVSMNGLAHGRVAEDGTRTTGWDALTYDSLDSQEGGASKRLATAQREFLATPAYANLSPRAKALFDPRAQSYYAALSEEAVHIDSRNIGERDRATMAANAAASMALADAVPLDDDESWASARDRGAADIAVMKLGTEILNPEALYEGGGSPDPARLRFRGGETMRAAFAATDEQTRQSMAATRAARMVDAAKAEPDPDRQDAFLSAAEKFAGEHGDEKTRAAVTTSAEAIRAAALRKEKLSALDALASGQAYDAAGNPRREAALKYAQPKIDAARRQEATRLATEQSRAMRANASFLSSSLEAGTWIDADGNIRPLDLNQRRQTALDALDKGLIGISQYQGIKDKLDAVEKSGRKADYEQISADVARAIAPDVKTVFRDGFADLSEKEKDPNRTEKDPNRTVLSYTVEERSTQRVPVMEGYATTRGGIPSYAERPTGATKEVPVVIRQKKELLARDIPQLINLLMDAKQTQGMAVWRDLDGNPVKKPAKADYAAYREFLLNDFSDRQTALDLDAKAGRARDAIAAARQAFAADEAAVLRKAAQRPPLPSASEPAAADDEENSLWP